MPGARMLWIVAMKLTAPSIDERPVRWAMKIHASWPPLGEYSFVDSGTYENHPASGGVQKNEAYSAMPPNRNIQYDQALSRGKATSRAPIISGSRKFARPAHTGTTTRNTIVVPCIVKSSL